MTVMGACIVALAGLALANARFGGSLLYPPAMFSALWAVLLAALAMSGDLFYRLSPVTAFLYLLGAASFSAGGFLSLLTLRLRRRERTPLSPRRRLFVSRALDVSLVVLLLAFPLYWRRLQQISSASGFAEFWIGLRMQTSERAEGGLGLFEYLAAWSGFLALAAFHESDGSRRGRIRAAALILLALVYQLLSMARVGAIWLIFGLIGIAWIRSGGARLKPLLAGAAVFLVVFSVPAVLLRKGGSVESGVAENAVGVLASLHEYSLGGLVALDHVVSHPERFPSEGRSLRFFSYAANTIGVDVALPPMNLEYIDTPAMTNVYTIYFPYFVDFGWAGVAVIMSALGGLAVGIHRSAAEGGDPRAVILYGLIFAGLALSNFSEPFLTGISYWIQAFAVTSVLYRWPLSGKRPTGGTGT